MIGRLLFGFYVLAVVAVVFFPIPIPLNWPANLSWKETLYNFSRINLSPFYFLGISEHAFSLKWLLVDLGLNAILTIPFGLGLGCIHKPGWRKLGFWALLTGLSMEGIQLCVILVTGTFYHTVDINDVILNAIGVVVGYCGSLLVQQYLRRTKQNKNPHLILE